MQAVRAVKAVVSKTGLSPCGIQRTLRAGLIGMKKGMTATWDQHGKRHPLTLLHFGSNQVVQVRSKQILGLYGKTQRLA